jgi:hypothetical protein
MAARSKKKLPLTRRQKVLEHAKNRLIAIRTKELGFLARRPHRSFRLTRRRDYNRSLKLPGYFAFTHQVNLTLKKHKKLFILLALFYTIISATIVGLGSQDAYEELTSTLRDTGSQIFEGSWGELSQAGFVLATIATSGLTENMTDVQQVYSVLLGLLAWLTTVWLLRNLLAGHKIRLRDGLYNAGSPIIPTFLVFIVFVVQLLPVGLATLGYVAASNTGLLSGGVEAMLFWAAAVLLMVASLYWVTSTFFALIIVTLPGMYPMRALKAAGDMVVGRRTRILLRLLWMAPCIILGWVIVMIPVILFDTWLKGVWPQIVWVPIIPVFLVAMTTVTIIWAATYIYLFYRKVVDDDAKPA